MKNQRRNQLPDLERYEEALLEQDKALLIKPTASHYIEKAWTLVALGRREALAASNKAVVI